MRLVKDVYELTGSFPGEERFGLIAQMRRAVVSIPSNIAEGQARSTPGEFRQFISHAEGSAAELDTQLLLSIDLGFIEAEHCAASRSLLEEVRKMLNALRRRLC